MSLEDAKLSTATRKKLSSSTFCGPNRSFPVPDCAHVRAAARLIGRAKVSPATKARIMACVRRKNKSMGCGVSIGDSMNEGVLNDAVEDIIRGPDYEDTHKFLRDEEERWEALSDQDKIAEESLATDINNAYNAAMSDSPE